MCFNPWQLLSLLTLKSSNLQTVGAYSSWLLSLFHTILLALDKKFQTYVVHFLP